MRRSVVLVILLTCVTTCARTYTLVSLSGVSQDTTAMAVEVSHGKALPITAPILVPGEDALITTHTGEEYHGIYVRITRDSVTWFNAESGRERGMHYKQIRKIVGKDPTTGALRGMLYEGVGGLVIGQGVLNVSGQAAQWSTLPALMFMSSGYLYGGTIGWMVGYKMVFWFPVEADTIGTASIN